MIERLIASSSGKVAFNTLAQVAGKAATLIISLIITALVTRSLGRAGYGDYSLARNFMLLFTLGVDFGLNAIVVREITRKKRATHRYFRNLLSLRLLLAIFFVLFGLSILPFFPYPQTVKWGIVIALLILIPQGLYRSANTIFQANFRYDLSVIAFILGQLADNTTRLQAIPLLLYYNFLFVLPLILASLLLYSNMLSLIKAREWNDGNKSLLRFLSGLALIALGFFVIPDPQAFHFKLRGHTVC